MILTFIGNGKSKIEQKENTPRHDKSHHPPPFTIPSCPFGFFVFQKGNARSVNVFLCEPSHTLIKQVGAMMR